jgi:hypothetical protein
MAIRPYRFAVLVQYLSANPLALLDQPDILCQLVDWSGGCGGGAPIQGFHPCIP